MNQAMLMKPPSILDEIISQDSENFTNKSNARSAAQKRNKKENTIRIGANSQESKNHSRQHDNESVHSNASGKSKGKKTKETTLARPKIMQSPKVQREDDNHSVHSTGSRHSQKSSKKENTIMPRPKIEGGIKARQEPLPSHGVDNKNQLSFKAAWNYQQESVIKGYEYKNQQSPQVMNYEQKYEHRQKQQRDQYGKLNAAPKYSPFAEMEHQYNSDDEPVIKLEEPAESKNHLVVGINRNLEKPRETQDKRPAVDSKPTIIQSRLAVQQSNVIFGQSKLRETKSRRRNIFDKTIHQNSSRVSNSIAQSSVSGLEDTTRRKSKSRLRELFNSSRQKKDREDSREGRDVKQSGDNMVTIGAVPLESKQFNQSTLNRSNFKPAVGVNDKLVQLQQKVLQRDNDQFYLQESKSDLNLSTSNNLGRAQYKDKDSLIFQFEPEKKKGMSVTSKEGRFPGDKSGEQMVKLHNNNLNSIKTYPNSKSSIDELPKIGNQMNSKELQSVQKILKENQEYLKNNEYKPQNPSAFKRQTGKEPYLFNIEDQESEVQGNTLNIVDANQRAWHQIVNEYQQEAVPIKTVQRNEKKINKDQRDREIEREKQRQKQRQREQKELAEKISRQREKERQRQIREIKEREEKQKQKEKQKQLRRQRQQQQKEQAQRINKEKLQAERKKQQQRRREAELEAEKERAIRQQQQEQRERRSQFLRREAQKRQKEREEMQAKKKKSEQVQERLVKLNSMPSSYSRDDSDNKSEKSNKSSKKVKQKKQTTLTRDKNHKVYVRNQLPRAQESFYQSSVQEPEDTLQEEIASKQRAQEKKPKLLTFSDDQPELKPKSKTDMNFYDCTQSQKSIKPPSSKPPLSKRTNGSGGSVSKEKKPKEKTIAINIKEQSLKRVDNKKIKPQKKMTLMQKALMKHNQSNDSCSEDSYRNRENFSSDGSRRSNSSKNSRASLKKQSTLNINFKDNAMIYSKHGKVPLQKKQSNSSSHEEEMQQIQRNRVNDRSRQRSLQRVREMRSNIPNERMIVSKNCTFIDERGRLVQKDLIIKGKEVYGAPGSNNDDSSQYFLERMKRSKEQRKKRSRSRDKTKLSRKQSREGSESGSCNQVSSYASSTFYQNNSNYPNYYAGSSCTGYPTNSNPLRQFIRPVEQVPMYGRDNQKNELPRGKPSAETKTLNEMFYRKNTTPLNANYSNMSQSRKSLGRTQKSLSKR